jgi:hypothetical protein
MMVRVRIATVCAALACVAAAPVRPPAGQVSGMVGAPQRQQAPVPRPTGTASIVVTVVSAEEGTLVKGARVTLVGTQAAGPSTAQSRAPGQAPVTDAATVTAATRDRQLNAVNRMSRSGAGGVITFADLPGGDYMVSAVPPAGFVVRDPLTRVRVDNGGQARVTLRLARGGVLTGRVFDEDGDAVTGAFVSAFRIPKNGGRPQPSGGSPSTNDLGAYRVWSLPPGDYVVSAWVRDVPTDDGPPEDAYLPSYFPGVAAIDAARVVQVKSGMETGGVDIQLVRGRLGSVTGRAVDSAGSYLGTNGPVAVVGISPRSSNPAFTGRGAAVQPDGSFVLTGVPAGDYFVSVTMVRGAGQSAVREAAYVPVTVNGDEVSVTLQANTGATVSGRIVLEGAPPPSGGPGGVAAPGRNAAPRVFVRQAISGDGQYVTAFSTGNSNSVNVRPDRTFTLTGLRGPIQLSATGARTALKSVTRGARDVSGQVMELTGTERIDDVVITLTYETGGIQGVVACDEQEAASTISILIYPDDPDRWGTGTPFLRLVRPGTGPTGGQTPGGAAVPGLAQTLPLPAEPGMVPFQFPTMAPGRYVVVAFVDPSIGNQTERQTLERWRDLGKVVTVDAGQTATVRVTAVR